MYTKESRTYISPIFDLAESTRSKSQDDSNASSGEANGMGSDESIASIVPDVSLHVCHLCWGWILGHDCELSMERKRERVGVQVFQTTTRIVQNSGKQMLREIRSRRMASPASSRRRQQKGRSRERERNHCLNWCPRPLLLLPRQY